MFFSGKQIKNIYQTKERQQDEKGEWWIAPRVAAEKTGYCPETLNVWSKRGGPGCPAFGGKVLDRKSFTEGQGQVHRFYSEEEIDRLIRAVNSLPLNPKVKGCVSLQEGRNRYKVAYETMHRLHEDEKLEIITRLGRDSDGKIREYHRVAVNGLKTYKKNRKSPPHPPDKITIPDAATLLGVQELAIRRLAKRKRWRRFPGQDKAGRPAPSYYLDRKVVEEEKAVRDGCGKRGLPFTWGGFTWLTNKAFLGKLGLRSRRGVATSRSTTCYLLDGRDYANQPPPERRRPVLAIQVPFSGWGQPEVWVLNKADSEVMLARKRGLISAQEASRQAQKILTACKAALKNDPQVMCNFSQLDDPGTDNLGQQLGSTLPAMPPPAPARVMNKGPGRPKGWRKSGAEDRDKRIKDDWKEDRKKPDHERKYQSIADLARGMEFNGLTPVS